MLPLLACLSYALMRGGGSRYPVRRERTAFAAVILSDDQIVQQRSPLQLRKRMPVGALARALTSLASVAQQNRLEVSVLDPGHM